MSSNFDRLPYDPTKLERELRPYYLGPDEKDIEQMLKAVSKSSLDDLYSHIPEEVRFLETPEMTERFEYEKLIDHVEALAARNNIKTSFIGDGLKHYQVPELTAWVSSLRGLTTAYTPYQPERSQGTLYTLWVYATTMSKLTGFEAINASMYDRSTALFEALNTGMKLKRGSHIALVSETIHPSDMEVLNTLAVETPLEIEVVPTTSKGTTDLEWIRRRLQNEPGKIAALAFTHINALGVVEDTDALTDIAWEANVKSIGVIDPMVYATGGLKQPSIWGKDKQGCNIIVGEAQHLAIAPNFGGPGLGLFGIRYNDKEKNAIRSTPGRYVGMTVDEKGNDALCMILSTREQHIRREKATSNICSNQSFLATLVGAAVLERGERGMTESLKKGADDCRKTVEKLLDCEGVELAFPDSPFLNEVALSVSKPANELIERASKQGLHLGVDITSRHPEKQSSLLLSFFDRSKDSDLNALISFFKKEFPGQKTLTGMTPIPQNWYRPDAVGLPQHDLEELKKFYNELAGMNVSPDDAIYPLGSCTMKYNPYINDYAASLPGFANIHPQAPEEDAQGCLTVLYETQEIFKKITGLPGVTTQPVAGAQGELVGIKMFQAYHRDKGENRDLILIPRSAHGTNPATATMAGYESKKVGGEVYGILAIDADENGQMNFLQLEELVKTHGKRIAGIMVTNPNTSGIFENNFKKMADLLHSIDALVYMDGANMNAIAGWVNLGAMGVDAVHNNLHKTWTVPHGGGGPGDAIVAVSERLLDFMPGVQVKKKDGQYSTWKPKKTIGSFHRNFGNFGHKVRTYTYLKALGSEGIRQMSAVAVLSSVYLYETLRKSFLTLPEAQDIPRMHEFILTLHKEDFDRIQEAGTPKAQTIAKVGKLFLDFGLHAPTVAFPEQYGLMVEPTESFTKEELDRFAQVVMSIQRLYREHPQVLQTVPHFTPVLKVDEVAANKTPTLSGPLDPLPKLSRDKKDPRALGKMNVSDICEEILRAHEERAR